MHILKSLSFHDRFGSSQWAIFGQVKAAHRMAKDVNMICGPFESLLQSAYAVAKRVRTETAIGERPVSIASAACPLPWLGG